MFSEIPFFKLFVALALGIIFSVFSEVNIDVYVVLVVFVALFIVHRIAHLHSKMIVLFGLVYLGFVFIVGVYFAGKQRQKANFKQTKKSEYVIGKITDAIKPYDNFIKTNLEIEAIRIDNHFEKSRGKCLLMIEKDSLSLSLKKGDYLQFEPEFKEIKSQTNPEAFDYKRYLFFHLISQQTYLKSTKWHKIKTKTRWFDIDRISDIRFYLLKQYREYGIKGDALSVLSALTLGYKNELDYTIRKAYASSGAIHVLAVSGLHVGIVFVIISFLLKILGRSKIARFFRFLLSLIFIWFFALLTGGTPSVLRASLMFSFIAFGIFLERQNSIYNSIFASAFLLLLYRPFLLFDLSFQLSYSAVISIVFFQPKIAQLVTVRYFIPKWIWSLTSVSLAAQIGTFPIIVFYFHQFPTYFLLSNFIVIPLATLIIWLSLLFFLSIKLFVAASFIAYLLQKIIMFQNVLIQKIEHLPFALIQNLYIDLFQLSILLLIILMVMQLTLKSNFKYWLSFGSFILIFLIYSNIKLYMHKNQKKLIVYDIKGVTAINLIDGDKNVLISSMQKDSKQKAFSLKPNWLSLGLEKEKFISTRHLNRHFIFSNLVKITPSHLFLKQQFIQFFNRRILYIQNKSFLSKYKPTRMNIDYIIIGQNTRIDISELNLYFNAKNIIIDASNSAYNLQFWKVQKAIYPSKNIYIVPEEGAFVHNICTTI